MTPEAIVPLLDLGIGVLETFLGRLKDHIPAEVAAAVQAAIDALFAHKNDLITKANIDAQRG